MHPGAVNHFERRYKVSSSNGILLFVSEFDKFHLFPMNAFYKLMYGYIQGTMLVKT